MKKTLQRDFSLPNSNIHLSSTVPPHGKAVFNWIQEDWLEKVQMGSIPVNYTLPAFLGSLKGQLNIKADCSRAVPSVISRFHSSI